MAESGDGLRAEVRKTLDELVASGREAGVRVAAYLPGEPVLHVVARVEDRDAVLAAR